MRAHAALGLAALVLMACSSRPSGAPAPREPVRDARVVEPTPTPTPVDATPVDSSSENAMIKSPRPTPEFEPAQPIAAKAELATWLGKQAADTLLRVPVELKVSVMGVEGATIGFGADRLAVKLNDSALGESLADRAAEFCGDAETCAMWVWGNWIDGGLRVTRAEGAIAAADRAAATHVLVAK